MLLKMNLFSLFCFSERCGRNYERIFGYFYFILQGPSMTFMERRAWKRLVYILRNHAEGEGGGGLVSKNRSQTGKDFRRFVMIFFDLTWVIWIHERVQSSLTSFVSSNRPTFVKHCWLQFNSLQLKCSRWKQDSQSFCRN